LGCGFLSEFGCNQSNLSVLVAELGCVIGIEWSQFTIYGIVSSFSVGLSSICITEGSINLCLVLGSDLDCFVLFLNGKVFSGPGIKSTGHGGVCCTGFFGIVDSGDQSLSRSGLGSCLAYIISRRVISSSSCDFGCIVELANSTTGPIHTKAICCSGGNCSFGKCVTSIHCPCFKGLALCSAEVIISTTISGTMKDSCACVTFCLSTNNSRPGLWADEPSFHCSDGSCTMGNPSVFSGGECGCQRGE